MEKIYDNLKSDSTKICYAFNVDDEDITSIKIELNSLSGNSDLTSFSDSSFKNSIGFTQKNCWKQHFLLIISQSRALTPAVFFLFPAIVFSSWKNRVLS